MPTEFHYRGAKRARTARHDLGLGIEPLEDILVTVEEHGPHVLVLALPEDVAGAYVRRDGLALAVVCGRDAVARQRFTLAHEFGHHWIGHDPGVDRQVTLQGYTHDPNEVEANSFAAEFLVPAKAIEAWDEQRDGGAITLEHVVRLAWRFGVSTQMMRYRLHTTGVLTSKKLRERLDAEIEEGLHVGLGEQLGLAYVQDTLADIAGHLPRIPARLRETYFGDLLVGAITSAEYAERFGCTLEDVQRMLVSLGLDAAMGGAQAA